MRIMQLEREGSPPPAFAISSQVVTQIQSTTSWTDSPPVRVPYAQPGSPVSTEQQNVNPLETARYRSISA
jgi:hypothetical protein